MVAAFAVHINGWACRFMVRHVGFDSRDGLPVGGLERGALLHRKQQRLGWPVWPYCKVTYVTHSTSVDFRAKEVAECDRRVVFTSRSASRSRRSTGSRRSPRKLGDCQAYDDDEQ